MIDWRFCNQIGTEKQHRFCGVLASKCGYSALRYAVADALKINVSRCQRITFTMRDASTVIDFLKAELDAMGE